MEREVGEEVKKRQVEGESGEEEFPLVPFLRRLNQIPTPRGPYSVPAKSEEVQCATHNGNVIAFGYANHNHCYSTCR